MDAVEVGPAARGSRLPYEELPAAVVAWTERALGGAVVDARTQHSGFSPGVAARLLTTGGRRAFLKAVRAADNPDSPGMHRREARVAAALPAAAPAPRLLASYDDGEVVALLFEDVDGRHPQLPWRAEELARVLDGLRDMARVLTPAPVDVPPVGETLGEDFTGWQTLSAGGADRLDDWARRHLDRLVDLEAGWADVVSGDTLLHVDVRADNVLLGTDGRAWFVDWPHAARGPAWFDVVAFAPSVAMQGGPPPADLLAGWDVDPDALVPVVAALAGYFAEHARRPPPPGIPTVRAFQAAQGAVAVRWLAGLTGWR